VAETFIRCLKERFEEANAVIELNGLKIAEDRSFADLARYMMTTLLQVGGRVVCADTRAERVCCAVG
jgi:translation initiation factor eIF-2B subunit epsilon